MLIEARYGNAQNHSYVTYVKVRIFSEQFYLDYRSESLIVNTLLPLLGTVFGRYFVWKINLWTFLKELNAISKDVFYREFRQTAITENVNPIS